MTTVRKQCLIVILIIAVVMPSTLFAGAANEPVDLEMVTRIRQEGFRHSQVMQTLSELTDRLGPRLTGSPSMKRANEWTRDQLTNYGLSNARLESWGPFGRGWEEQFTSVRMLTPDVAMLSAIPRAWTPGTNGVVHGKVMKLKVDRKEDLEKYKGKLAGMIVLAGDMRDVKPQTDPVSVRYSDAKLDEIAQYQIPGERPSMGMGSGAPGPDDMRRRMELSRAMTAFLNEEKPLAVIEPSRYDSGLVTMSGTQAYKTGENPGVPTLNMAIEHYGRISRLLDRDVPVELELNVQTRFVDDDPMAYNTLAEIAGSDKKDEVVLIGAHLDSWHGGTGATDNAVGVAAVMEAARILKTLGVKPRRTIRVALWSGEEQGLLGSRAYVAQHFATRPEPPKDAKDSDLPSYMRRPTGPLSFKPEYKTVAAYFNIDNGTGKLRGIYAQENASVVPIFQAWIEPFKDLGVTAVSMRNTGSTDHASFDAVGLPGFQFIQDPVEYMSKTHHTNMDVYERIQREDMMEQAVVLASFAYNAAMRDQPLPRKPLPAEDIAPTPQRATSAAK